MLEAAKWDRLQALDDGLLALAVGRELHGAPPWILLAVSPRAQVVGRTTLERDAVGLVAARVGSGIAVAGLSGTTTYSDYGRYQFHNWTFSAEHRFVDVEHPSEWEALLSPGYGSGEGMGGYDLEWLVRPERAAILMWSTGDASLATQLIPVRGPCLSDP